MKEQLPKNFKDASIIHIYKRKGNWQACDNHRGISLFSILGNILARVLPNRLKNHLEHGLFRKERGTVDVVFTTIQVQEKCWNGTLTSHSTYVRLTKAFATVSRNGLWRIMAKYGCPEKLITIVRQFHNDTHARVQDNGESSIAFPITNEIKQGCILALNLFSIMFSAMLLDAFKGSENGIDIWYHTDGFVFNLRGLQAKI